MALWKSFACAFAGSEKSHAYSNGRSVQKALMHATTEGIADEGKGYPTVPHSCTQPQRGLRTIARAEGVSHPYLLLGKLGCLPNGRQCSFLMTYGFVVAVRTVWYFPFWESTRKVFVHLRSVPIVQSGQVDGVFTESGRWKH